MKLKTATGAFFFCFILFSHQNLTIIINASLSLHQKYQETSEYTWIWEELASAPEDVSGEDIVFYGENFGPYHNYSELTYKLHKLNKSFPELVEVFSIGKSWNDMDIWCVRLTNESISTPKTEFYVIGEHHAREIITVENCLYFIDQIVYQVTTSNNYRTLLAEKELYIIPMLNPDGLSILHWYPEQRKNLKLIDDDEDGNYIDEEERSYYWNSTLSTSVLIEEDLDNDTFIGEDRPGGVDLNRNYAAYWNTTGSSSDKNSQVYHGPFPMSENETRVVRDFINQHHFNFAVSLHSGIEAIITPWAYNTTYPTKDGLEYSNIVSELKTITGFPSWTEIGGYAAGGSWDDFNYLFYDIMSFTLETFSESSLAYFDSFNPRGGEILTNCELVFNALEYLASEPHITYSNLLPQIKVTNPSTINQVFENYTIKWSMEDIGGEIENCSVLVSNNGYNWKVLGTNLQNQNSLFWNVSSEEPGSYYLKVAVYDGMDWISDTSEILLNVRKTVPVSPYTFWILAGIFASLASIYLFFYIRKSRNIEKMWRNDLPEEKKQE